MGEGVVTPEAVGYWFFRLNGCLTTTNFVLHPDRRGPQRTDADVPAERFPHRSELADTDDHFRIIPSSTQATQST